ncbi:MAG: ergothioneine biosynthesis protein EgtB [Gemmatimonadetes bacterium]|nr:ergothioneine biosynthesis protein EgtB [Gemmatimonadota bacterium]MDA1104584.1 ergothioneine biosynthesis protein EgtB [Gemmatimonadota bacterium]
MTPSPALVDRFRETRARTEALCAPLETEDFVVSSMPDVSPTKWHLAHTSWFFETFLLGPHGDRYESLDPRYAFLFNSYYVQAGERHCRAQRGLVTRPTVAEVFSYRAHVDEHVLRLCDALAGDADHPAWPIVELGIHHEQQHQELLLTDIKHVLWTNPLRPSYEPSPRTPVESVPQGWHTVDEGVYRVGHSDEGFSFDNEGPEHRVFADGFRLATRLVTNAEYLDFIEDGGYQRAPLWLSPGWAAVQEHALGSPLYWEATTDGWTEFTLAGPEPLELDAPVCHVSYYEADAFARWAGHALPTEHQWEIAARDFPVCGHFAESGRHHPSPAAGGMAQLYGDVWQWTRSAYTAYPGYVPSPGAIGEYNGKWMSDQWVLRGASCATASSHARISYRNFFPSDARWQFTGIRLVEAP